MAATKESQRKAKRVGKFEILHTLGEGTFGKVKLAKNIETNEMVAVKIVDKEQILHQNMGQQIKKEISIMKQLDHPNVVQLLEVLASWSKIFIVIEYISGGELFEEIVRKGKFGEDEARKYFRQMMDGIRYCHSQGVCHRDLKPENLLLDSRKNLKISDFGLSNFMDGGEATPKEATPEPSASGDTAPTEASPVPTLLRTTCGTPNYVAPEVLEDKGYDGKTADLWSCGVILYVLLAGFLPFHEKTMAELFHKIKRAEFEYPPWFSKEAKHLLSLMLVKDPKTRISLDTIQKNAWYNKGFEPEAAPRQYKPITVTKTQLASAVSTVKMTEMTAGASADAAVAGASADAAVAGPRTLNAFDLINMVGGLALENLFNYHKGSHVSWKRFYHFESGLSVDKIVSGMKHVMGKTGMTTLQSETPHSMVFNLKRKGQRSNLCVDVFVVLKNLHIVEIRRQKGDAIAYFKFMDQIGPLISKEIGINDQLATGIDATTSVPPALPAIVSDNATASASPVIAVDDAAASDAPALASF